MGDLLQPPYLRRYRLVLAGRVTFFALLAFWLYTLLNLSLLEPAALPGLDFIVFQSASRMALDGAAEATYDAIAFSQTELRYGGAENAGNPWQYPPNTLLFVLPLATLGLVPAFAAWIVAGGAVLLTALRRIAADAAVFWIAAAFPALAFNALIGQTGLLTAGLFAWGMLLLNRKPLAAGAVLGLMALKPHFLPLILVALVASGRRRAASGLLASAGASVLLSALIFGFEPWLAFFDNLQESEANLYAGLPPLDKMVSVAATLVHYGAPAAVARLLQGIVTVASVAAVVWLWRQRLPFDYQVAGLGLAMTLATPYAFHYDLTLLGVALLWPALRWWREGLRPGDTPLLTLIWFSPLLCFIAGGLLGLPLGPLVLGAVGWLVWRRARLQPATSSLALNAGLAAG